MLLRRLWAWWEPIALVMRVARGRFGEVPAGARGFWTSRPPSDHSLTGARRQA